MGYNKMLVYGSKVELYEYEKNINTIRGIRNKREFKSEISNGELALSGVDDVQQIQVGKRQDSARHASMVFRRLVSSNLVGTDLPLLVTITYSINQTDLRQGYRDFKSFNQALRYKFGKDFKYICVPEFQKRGAVHFHALYWGLPERIFLEERKTRFLARLWGQGFIYLKQTDGNIKISSYLAKYMSKAFCDMNLKNQKAFVCSRNVLRPVVYSGIDSIFYLLDDYVGMDIVPCKEKRFMSKWLGEVRYREYDILPSRS